MRLLIILFFVLALGVNPVFAEEELSDAEIEAFLARQALIDRSSIDCMALYSGAEKVKGCMVERGVAARDIPEWVGKLIPNEDGRPAIQPLPAYGGVPEVAPQPAAGTETSSEQMPAPVVQTDGAATGQIIAPVSAPALQENEEAPASAAEEKVRKPLWVPRKH